MIKLGLNDLKTIANIKEVRGGTILIWQNTQLVENINFINSTSNSIKMNWIASPSFTHYSITRNGTEVYRGTITEFMDYFLDPSTTYTYEVFGHDGITGEAQGTGNTFPFSTTAIYGTIYPETTNYMNAIGVSNDGTLYWSGTAQEVTGAQVWQGFNEIVHYFKTYGYWDKFFFWNPTFGTTYEQLKINAKDVSDYKLTTSGPWTLNSLGIAGNGVDTFAEWYRADGTVVKTNQLVSTYNAALGYTVTHGGTGKSIEVEMGQAESINARFFIGAHVGAYGGSAPGFGDKLTPVDTLPVLGSYTALNESVLVDTYHFVKNGKFIHTKGTGTNGGSWGGPHKYQLRLGDLGVSPSADSTNYKSTKRIASPFIVNDVTGLGNTLDLNKGMEMWENYINRKIW